MNAMRHGEIDGTGTVARAGGTPPASDAGLAQA